VKMNAMIFLFATMTAILMIACASAPVTTASNQAEKEQILAEVSRIREIARVHVSFGSFMELTMNAVQDAKCDTLSAGEYYMKDELFLRVSQYRQYAITISQICQVIESEKDLLRIQRFRELLKMAKNYLAKAEALRAKVPEETLRRVFKIDQQKYAQNMLLEVRTGEWAMPKDEPRAEPETKLDPVSKPDSK